MGPSFVLIVIADDESVGVLRVGVADDQVVITSLCHRIIGEGFPLSIVVTAIANNGQSVSRRITQFNLIK
jgi:hypothetical protein